MLWFSFLGTPIICMSDLPHFQCLSLYLFLHFFLILLILYYTSFSSIFISFRFLNDFSFISPFLKVLSVVFICLCVLSKFRLYFWKKKKCFIPNSYICSVTTSPYFCIFQILTLLLFHVLFLFSMSCFDIDGYCFTGFCGHLIPMCFCFYRNVTLLLTLFPSNNLYEIWPWYFLVTHFMWN